MPKQVAPMPAEERETPVKWEGDLPTEHVNRCRLRDKLLYADIFNDDGTHRPVWRCHKRAGHDGPCSSHNDCGVMNGGVTCGRPPGHSGLHQWATEITVPALPAEDRAVTAPQEQEKLDNLFANVVFEGQRGDRLEAKLAALTHAIEALRGEMEQEIGAGNFGTLQTQLVTKWVAILKATK
jgi:hypothetical protein